MAQIQKTQRKSAIKTRAEKIKSQERRAKKTVQPASEVLENSLPVKPVVESTGVWQAQDAQTILYAKEELRQIAWISLVCLALLAVSTLLLSEIPLISGWRQTMGLPTITFF